ncbi:MAG: hypothetical protein JNL84_00595 [Candidatus Accumulibacter sp.]|nr:hypothetical protein [Accumulibacter sp.]
MSADEKIHPSRVPAKPVGEPVVIALARLANDLETLKNTFPEPLDRAALMLAVRHMHRVAMAHDQAGGYGRYVKSQQNPGGEP